MPISNYEGKLVSKSSEGSISYYGYKDFYQAQDSFILNGKIIGSTLYNPPSSRYKAALEDSKFVLMNAEAGTNYLESVKGSVGSFGPDISYHFKSYTREFEGKVEAMFPTSNASRNNREDGKFKDFNKFIYEAAKVLPFLNKIDQLAIAQQNTGIVVKGKAAEKFLAFQENLAKGISKDKVDLAPGFYLSRGDTNAKVIIAGLERAQRGDEIELTSPYLSNEDIVLGLAATRKKGARVIVSMAPAYTTNPTRQETIKRLANFGIEVYTNDGGNLVHQKNFTIDGKGIKLAITGSDNFTHYSSTNKTLDYSLVAEGNSPLLAEIRADNAQLRKTLKRVKSPRTESYYSQGEMGFLYQTQYQTYSGVKPRPVAAAELGGFIKATKLNSDYFDRHIIRDLPIYKGFSSTYKAISGLEAPEAVKNMDRAVGAASAGHQINRVLGMRLYMDSKGLLGSAISGVGRLADYLTGHYAFKDDMAQHKGDTKGSIKKFTALIADRREAEKYKGGPLEQASAALYHAAQGFVVSGIGYGAVLAFQYRFTAFLEEGARRATEIGTVTTKFQEIVVSNYLSEEGIAVMHQARSNYSYPQGPPLSANKAYLKALNQFGILDENMLVANEGFKAAGMTNKLRLASASFMEYVLPSILEIIVPAKNLDQAMTYANELLDVMRKPIEMKDGVLVNLNSDRSKKMGAALDKLGQLIPLKLHYWVPQIRAQSGVTEIAAGNPSLAKVFGENFLNQIIGSFVQTTQTAVSILHDPRKHLDYLEGIYRNSTILEIKEASLVNRLNRGNLTESALKRFLEHQAQTAKEISHYHYNAPALTQSLGQGIKVNRPLGKMVFAITATLAGDYLLDQFVLRNQGANLIDQIKLTRAARTSEGNILQIEFNATMPVYTSLGVAAVSGLTAGYAFPTIYGVNRNTSRFYQAINNPQLVSKASSGVKDLINQINPEVAASVRARFNAKAAFVGIVLGLAAAKVGFYGAAAIANTFFTAKGVKLDPATEVATGKVIDVLNRSKRELYDLNAGKEGTINSNATTRTAITRELLKFAVNSMSDSENRLDTMSSGSSFYSVAFQLSNTSFLQTAILQRTDAAKGLTSYSFGLQLMPAAGIGMTPMLPIGITNRFTADKKNEYIQGVGFMSTLNNFLLRKDGNPDLQGADNIKNLANLAFAPFSFLAYSPNSNITNTMMSLGVLQMLSSGMNFMSKNLNAYKSPTTGLGQDYLAAGKAVKFGVTLLATSFKYSLALTDLLPRMVGAGLKVGAAGFFERLSQLGLNNRYTRNLYGQRYNLIAFGIAAALTDPLLGVDPLDERNQVSGKKYWREGDAPFGNPVNRLITAGAFTVYAAAAFRELGIGSTPIRGGFFSRVIPGAAGYQNVLLNASSNNLRKSGARAGLVASLVFSTYLVSSITARIIGQMSGEKGLNDTYRKVGLLRLFSGVAASDYREKDRYKRGVFLDTVSDLVSKVPFVGESLTKITGLYKDDPNLFLPLPGTPYGATLKDSDNSTRGYIQNQSGTTDGSIARYTKFLTGLSRDSRGLMENLEGINFDRVTNPAELMRAAIRGGPVRSSGMKTAPLSPYAGASIGSSLLLRALNRRKSADNQLMFQRASELSYDEYVRQVKFGEATQWANGQNVKLPLYTFGFNEGVEMFYTQWVKQKVAKSGEYETFENLLERSVYSQRNVFSPSLGQPALDLSNTYFKSGDKGSAPLFSSGFLSLIVGGLMLTTVYNTAFAGLHLVSAVESVKYGKSLLGLEAQRTASVTEFVSHARIKVKAANNAAGQIFHIIEPLNSLTHLTSAHQIDFKAQGLSAQDYAGKNGYHNQLISKLQNRLESYPMSMRMANKVNLFETMMMGGTNQENAILKLRTEMGRTLKSALGVSAGTGTLYDIVVKRHQATPMEMVPFIQQLVSEEAYAPLAVYANQLKANTTISQSQKIEMLNLMRIEIEKNLLLTNVFKTHTNFLDDVYPNQAAPIRSGSLTSKGMRALGGLSSVVGTYMFFGKEGYSLAEASVFLLSSNRSRRQASSEALYDTATSFGSSLIIQKGIANAFGTKMFGLGTLLISGAALFGINFGIGKLEKSSFGHSVKHAERMPKDFVSGGINSIFGVISQGTSWLFDILAEGVFAPLGETIQNTYNKSSQTSAAHGILAEMFLPTSIFKVSSYVERRTAYGNLPYVQADAKGYLKADLRRYYRNANAAGLRSTMEAEPSDFSIHPFLMGRASGYNEREFSAGYFDAKKRPEGTALSNFSMQSNYNISSLMYYALARRESSNRYEQYGRVFRRPKMDSHDYLGQMASGLSVFNEVTRLARSKDLEISRVIGDEYARVDRYALGPIRNVAGNVISTVANYIVVNLLPGVKKILELVGRPFVWAISVPFKLIAGLPPVIRATATQFATSAVQGTLTQLNKVEPYFAKKTIEVSSRLTTVAKPVATITLQALSAASKMAGYAAAMGISGLSKFGNAPIAATSTALTLYVPPVNPPEISPEKILMTAEKDPLNLFAKKVGHQIAGGFGKVMHFANEALPTILDAAQILPSTYALLNYDDLYLTKSQTTRFYEQQGSAVGGVAFGLISLASRLSLIPTIALSIAGAYGFGGLGKMAGGRDYDEHSRFWAGVQSIAGGVVLGLSAVQTAFTSINKVKLYKNYTQINTGPGGVKQAEIVYDAEYTKDRQKEGRRRSKLLSGPQSAYSAAKMRRSNRRQVNLLMENFHEQHHVVQYQPDSGFERSNVSADTLLDKLGITEVKDRTRFSAAISNISEMSAQQHLIDNPLLHGDEYQKIHRLEIDANNASVDQMLRAADIHNANPKNINSQISKEEIIRHVYRAERQIISGRFMGRKPFSEKLGFAIEKLYSFGSSKSSGRIGNVRINSTHFANIAASGFHKGSRILLAGTTSLALPGALYESFSITSELNRIQNSYEEGSSPRAVQYALKNRGQERIRYAYSGSYLGVFNSVFKNPAALLMGAAYIALGQSGARLPFINIPLVPTPGIRTFADAYAKAQYLQAMKGEYVYDPGLTGALPLMQLKQHAGDTAAREFVGGGVSKLLKSKGGIAGLAIGLAALTYQNREALISTGPIGLGLLAAAGVGAGSYWTAKWAVKLTKLAERWLAPKVFQFLFVGLTDTQLLEAYQKFAGLQVEKDLKIIAKGQEAAAKAAKHAATFGRSIITEAPASLKSFVKVWNTYDVDYRKFHGDYLASSKLADYMVQGAPGSFRRKASYQLLTILGLHYRVGHWLEVLKQGASDFISDYGHWNTASKFSPKTGIPIEYMSKHYSSQISAGYRRVLQAASVPYRYVMNPARSFVRTISTAAILTLERLPQGRLHPGNFRSWFQGRAIGQNAAMSSAVSMVANPIEEAVSAAAPANMTAIAEVAETAAEKEAAAFTEDVGATVIQKVNKLNWFQSLWGNVTKSFGALERGAIRSINHLGTGNAIGALANRLIVHGAIDTTITGLEAVLASKDLASATWGIMGLSSSTRKHQYQEAYVTAASGRSTFISVFGLFPAFGLLKGGLLLGVPLTAFEQFNANKQGEKRWNSLHTRNPNWHEKAYLIVNDIIRPTLQQTLFASALPIIQQVNQAARVSNALVVKGSALTGAMQGGGKSSKLGLNLLTSSPKSGFFRTKLLFLHNAQMRAVSAFGETAAQTATDLAARAAAFGKGAAALGGKFLTILNVGLVLYDFGRAVTAKTPEQQRESYAAFGGSLTGLVVGTIAATLITPIALLAGPAAPAIILAAGIAGNLLGNWAGSAMGAFVSDVKNFSVEKAASNTGRDIVNTVKTTGDFFNWAGSILQMGGKLIMDLGGAFIRALGNLFGSRVEAAEIPPQLKRTSTTAIVANSYLAQTYESANNQINSPSWLDSLSAFWQSNTKRLSDFTGRTYDGIAKTATTYAQKAVRLWGKAKRTVEAIGQNLGLNSPAQAFSGKIANYEELAGMTKSMPGGGSDLRAALIGNVYAGRAEQTITFTGSESVSPEVRGKTLTIDSGLKALSDLVAIRETEYPTSMRSYGRQDPGNANSGRYQIIFGGDTRSLGKIVQGGVTGTTPDQQERAFLGRLFWNEFRDNRTSSNRVPGKQDRGGSAYYKFIQGGYKYNDFVKMVQGLANEWQSLREDTYGDTKNPRDNYHLSKYYGSGDKGYQFLYQYFLKRKEMYETEKTKESAVVTPPASAPVPKAPTGLGSQVRYTPAEADRVAKPVKVAPVKPKTVAALPAEQIVATVTLGESSSTVPVSSKSGVQPTMRPEHKQVQFRMEDGKLAALMVKEAAEETFNSRANTPASYKTGAGVRMRIC